MKKVLTILVTVALLVMTAVPAFAVNDSTTPQDPAVTGTDGKAFRQQFQVRQEERKAMVTEAKSLWGQVKGVRDSIKTEWTRIKGNFSTMDKDQKKAAVQDLKSKLQVSRDLQKSTRSDIKSLKDQKKTEWVNYKEAVKAKDSVKASTSLDNIISFRKTINEKIQQLLSVSQNILSTLSGYGK